MATKTRQAARTEFEKPKEVQPVELSMLWADFKIQENGTKEWLIHCKHCKAVWALQRTSPVHAGNILSLMNHGFSHGT